MTVHLVQSQTKWCDYPGYAKAAYCGAHNGGNYVDKFHLQPEYVDCEDCLERYGMELLRNL